MAPRADPSALAYAMRHAGYGADARRLARAAGVREESVRGILEGRVARPRPQTLLALADALDVEPSDLLEETRRV